MKRLILDTETTGLSPRFNKTLTVGLVLADFKPKTFKILNQDHIFIKHSQYNANPFAMRINKINLEHHHKIAIPACKACNQINSFIKKNKALTTPLVGHNLRFDNNFLSALFNNEDIQPLFHHEQEDTMQIWKNLQKQNIVPQGKASLKTVASHFEIDYSNAHDALADCHITAQVYHKMLKI